MIPIIYFDSLSYAIKNVVIILIRWNGCFTFVSKVVVFVDCSVWRRRHSARASTYSDFNSVAVAPVVGVVMSGLTQIGHYSCSVIYPPVLLDSSSTILEHFPQHIVCATSKYDEGRRRGSIIIIFSSSSSFIIFSYLISSYNINHHNYITIIHKNKKIKK